jgi:hypothetical protein
MKLHDLQKSWRKLPWQRRWEIGSGIVTVVLIIYMVILLTIEKSMLQ